MKRSSLFLVLAGALAGVLLLFFMVGRSSDETRSRGTADPATSGSGAVVEPVHPDSVTAAASESGTPDDAPASSFLLALDGEGLRLFDSVSGSSRPLTFGIDGGVARSALVTVLGAEPVEEGFSEDCAANYLRWANGLSIWVVRDNFVGWSLRDDGSTLTTPTGVGLGSTRSELEDSYAAEIFESSLGEEFAAGGLAGLLESDDDDARIIYLWAGQTCIAR